MAAPLTNGGRRPAATGGGADGPGTLAASVVARPAVPAVSDAAPLAGWAEPATNSRTAAAIGSAMRAPRPPQCVPLAPFIVAPFMSLSRQGTRPDAVPFPGSPRRWTF